MRKFKFITKTSNITDISGAFKPVAIPSPKEGYRLTMTYYRNPSFKNGVYNTNEFPHIFSEIRLFVQKINENYFYSYEYSGNVMIRRHIDKNSQYDDIMNLEGISNDIQNEWAFIEQYCS